MWGRGGQADQAAGGRARGRDLVPVGVGVALLAAPLVSWVDGARPGRRRVQDAGPARPVRVLSYNLHFGFDVRGWSDLEGVARAIEASGAEVVGLQEVSRGWYVNGATDMLAWLQRRLRMPYARFAGASDAIWGNALLSRYPIVAGEVVRLPREGVPLRRNALRVELDLGAGRRLSVVVTHLHHVEGPDGARVRLAQVPRLLELVGGRPATVLMGDLNAEPGSAEIGLLRAAGLTDAFAAAGGGPADAPTWPADRPDRRIDWIWLSGDLAATGFVATTSTASDHRGIAVTVQPAAWGRPTADRLDRSSDRPLGLVGLGEDGVEAPARVVEDLQGLGLLGLGAGAGHAPGGLDDLAQGVAEAPGRRGHAGHGLLPRRLLVLALGLGPAGVGEGEPAAALALLTGDQVLVLEQLEGRVDRPRARPPDAAGARLQLLDHLVAVHRPLGQQGQDRGPDVAPAAPSPPPTPAAEAPRPRRAGRHGRRRGAERPVGAVVAQPLLVGPVSVHEVSSSHAASPPELVQRSNDISLTLDDATTIVCSGREPAAPDGVDAGLGGGM